MKKKKKNVLAAVVGMEYFLYDSEVLGIKSFNPAKENFIEIEVWLIYSFK